MIYDINTGPQWDSDGPPVEPSRRLRVRVACGLCLAVEVACTVGLVALWAVR